MIRTSVISVSMVAFVGVVLGSACFFGTAEPVSGQIVKAPSGPIIPPGLIKPQPSLPAPRPPVVIVPPAPPPPPPPPPITYGGITGRVYTIRVGYDRTPVGSPTAYGQGTMTLRRVTDGKTYTASINSLNGYFKLLNIVTGVYDVYPTNTAQRNLYGTKRVTIRPGTPVQVDFIRYVR